MYYTKEVRIELKNNGNDVIAVMNWFNDDEVWPYNEWAEEIEIKDVKMMTEKEIEEQIKEEFKKTIKREFEPEALTFEWR